MSDRAAELVRLRREQGWVGDTLGVLVEEVEMFEERGDALFLRDALKKATAALAVTLKHCAKIKAELPQYVNHRRLKAAAAAAPEPAPTALAEKVVARLTATAPPQTTEPDF